MSREPVASVVSGLEASRADLLLRARGLSQHVADWKPGPERWSAGEILDHIALVDEAVDKLLARLLERRHRRGPAAGGVAAPSPALPADLAARITAIPVFPGAVPRPGRPVRDLLDALAGSRDRLLARARESEGLDTGGLSFPHPALGRLDFAQWLLFVAEHERGHTLQLDGVLDLERRSRRG